VLAVLAKYTGRSVAQVTLGLPYIDAEARLDMDDILRQVN